MKRWTIGIMNNKGLIIGHARFRLKNNTNVDRIELGPFDRLGGTITSMVLIGPDRVPLQYEFNIGREVRPHLDLVAFEPGMIKVGAKTWLEQ